MKPAGIYWIQIFLGVQSGRLELQWAFEPLSVISPHWATATVKSINLSELLQNPTEAKQNFSLNFSTLKIAVLHVDLNFTNCCPYVTRLVLISCFNIHGLCVCVCVCLCSEVYVLTSLHISLECRETCFAFSSLRVHEGWVSLQFLLWNRQTLLIL